MNRGLRVLMLLSAAVVVTAFAAASVATYRPLGVTDALQASEKMRKALLVLDDETRASADRFAAFSEGLNESRRLLVRALRVNPTDTSSIELLAVVRWELAVLIGEPDRSSVSALAAIAVDRAPRVPNVQFGLGELFLRMGLFDDAARFMRAALELSPGKTTQAVKSMLDAGLDPAAIAGELRQTVQLVVALKEPFERSGNREEWLTTVEEILSKYPYELIWLYAESCLATNSASRLLQHAQSLGELESSRAEARRQIAIGRARLLNHDLSGAVTASAKARALASSDTSVLSYAGQIAMAAGNASDAEACFRQAIHTLALATGQELDRGRLYRQHGQTLESLGRIDEAFAAYRRARELSPDDPWLKERFANH